MGFAIYLLVGLSGLACHWYTRYVQGRTHNSFIGYLNAYRSRTVTSVMSIFATASGIFATSPPELSMQTLLLAFSTGYMLDSMTNKDSPSVPTGVTVGEAKKMENQLSQVKVQADADKKLADILSDDQSL